MAESGVLWGGKTARDESFLRNLLNFEAREKYLWFLTKYANL